MILRNGIFISTLRDSLTSFFIDSVISGSYTVCGLTREVDLTFFRVATAPGVLLRTPRLNCVILFTNVDTDDRVFRTIF